MTKKPSTDAKDLGNIERPTDSVHQNIRLPQGKYTFSL